MVFSANLGLVGKKNNVQETLKIIHLYISMKKGMCFIQYRNTLQKREKCWKLLERM
jgi:hypothetical protein